MEKVGEYEWESRKTESLENEKTSLGENEKHFLYCLKSFHLLKY